MSSFIKKRKYKVALFQGGLADNGHGFDETIVKLATSSSNVVSSSERLDMSHFNCTTNSFYAMKEGYYSQSAIATNNFKAQIANIVALAKENEGKTILVSTYVNHGFNSTHDLDSIANQKTKLNFIVDEFKNYYSDVDLILIGHSQGGLVNLESAIDKPNKILRLISISTPYSPVYLADRLMFIDFFFSLGGESAYSLFAGDSNNISAYKASVEKLSSSSYFTDLKNRWNNLSSRPPLTVITGTAGHLFNIIPGVSSPDYYVPDTILKDPFDGLVKFSEQANIGNASFIHLVNRDVPCFADRTYAQNTCYCQSGFYFSCRRSCNLKSISLSGTIIDAFFSLIDNAINGRNIQELANYPVAVAIFAGLSKNPNKVPSGDKYQDYYKIYSDDYNHNFARYCDETIGYLLSLVN